MPPGLLQAVPVATTNIIDKVIPEEHEPSSGCHDFTCGRWSVQSVLKSFEVQNQQQCPSPFRSLDSGIVARVLRNDNEVHRVFCFRLQGAMLAQGSA